MGAIPYEVVDGVAVNPQRNALASEVQQALELAKELRIEGGPEALEDASQLEAICSYWGHLLEEAPLRKVTSSPRM